MLAFVRKSLQELWRIPDINRELGTIRALQNPVIKGDKKNNPETRSETPEEIGQSNKQLVHNDIKVTFNSGFLETFHIGHG